MRLLHMQQALRQHTHWVPIKWQNKCYFIIKWLKTACFRSVKLIYVKTLWNVLKIAIRIHRLHNIHTLNTQTYTLDHIVGGVACKDLGQKVSQSFT